MVTRHPAKKARPMRKPVKGADGFSDAIYENRMRLWNERDNPDLSQRVTSQPDVVQLEKDKKK